MRVCDVHCHVDTFVRSADEIRLLNSVGPTIAVTNDWQSYVDTKALARRMPNIYVSLGLHPDRASLEVSSWAMTLGELPDQRLVGEIGLDYYRHKGEQERKNQRIIFEAILDACEGSDRILNIHSTGAERDVAQVLESYDTGAVIMHWFVGPLKLVESGVEEGWYFSVPPIVQTSKKVQEVARLLPEDLLLIESDAPDGLVGGLSLQKSLQATISKVAQVRHSSTNHILRVTTRNFERLLKPTISRQHGQKPLEDWIGSASEAQDIISYQEPRSP